MANNNKRTHYKLDDKLWNCFLTTLETKSNPLPVEAHSNAGNAVSANSFAQEHNPPTRSSILQAYDESDERNDVVVLSSDSENENETIWSNNSKNKVFKRLWEKARNLIFHRLLTSTHTIHNSNATEADQVFPYQKLQELCNDLRNFQQNFSLSTAELVFLWNNVLQWLSAIKLSTDTLDLNDDVKFNLVLIEFMVEYINCNTKLYSTHVNANGIQDKIEQIVQTLSIIFNGSEAYIIMTLLRIESKMEYRLILSPIYEKFLTDRAFCDACNDFVVYLRLVFCFKRWKMITPQRTEREKINEIAAGKSIKNLREENILENESILPKAVPKINSQNKAFASISDLIGFAMERKAIGTRILLVYDSLDLDDAINKYFRLYDRYSSMKPIYESVTETNELCPTNVGAKESNIQLKKAYPQKNSNMRSAIQHSTRNAMLQRRLARLSSRPQHLKTNCDRSKNKFSISSSCSILSQSTSIKTQSDISILSNNRISNTCNNKSNLGVIEIDSTDDDDDADAAGVDATSDMHIGKKKNKNKITQNCLNSKSETETSQTVNLANKSKCSYNKQTTSITDNIPISLSTSSEDENANVPKNVDDSNNKDDGAGDRIGEHQAKENISTVSANSITKSAVLQRVRCRTLLESVVTKPTRKEEHCIPGEVSSTTSPDNINTENVNSAIAESLPLTTESLEVHSAGTHQTGREVGTVKVIEQRFSPWQSVVVSGSYQSYQVDYSDVSSENDDETTISGVNLNICATRKVVKEATSSTTEINQQNNRSTENVVFSTTLTKLTPLQRSKRPTLSDDEPICSKYIRIDSKEPPDGTKEGNQGSKGTRKENLKSIDQYAKELMNILNDKEIDKNTPECNETETVENSIRSETVGEQQQNDEIFRIDNLQSDYLEDQPNNLKYSAEEHDALSRPIEHITETNDNNEDRPSEKNLNLSEGDKIKVITENDEDAQMNVDIFNLSKLNSTECIVLNSLPVTKTNKTAIPEVSDYPNNHQEVLRNSPIDDVNTDDSQLLNTLPIMSEEAATRLNNHNENSALMEDTTENSSGIIVESISPEDCENSKTDKVTLAIANDDLNLNTYLRRFSSELEREEHATNVISEKSVTNTDMGSNEDKLQESECNFPTTAVALDNIQQENNKNFEIDQTEAQSEMHNGSTTVDKCAEDIEYSIEKQSNNPIAHEEINKSILEPPEDYIDQENNGKSDGHGSKDGLNELETLTEEVETTERESENNNIKASPHEVISNANTNDNHDAHIENTSFLEPLDLETASKQIIVTEDAEGQNEKGEENSATAITNTNDYANIESTTLFEPHREDETSEDAGGKNEQNEEAIAKNSVLTLTQEISEQEVTINGNSNEDGHIENTTLLEPHKEKEISDLETVSKPLNETEIADEKNEENKDAITENSTINAHIEDTTSLEAHKAHVEMTDLETALTPINATEVATKVVTKTSNTASPQEATEQEVITNGSTNSNKEPHNDDKISDLETASTPINDTEDIEGKNKKDEEAITKKSIITSSQEAPEQELITNISESDNGDAYKDVEMTDLETVVKPINATKVAEGKNEKDEEATTKNSITATPQETPEQELIIITNASTNDNDDANIENTTILEPQNNVASTDLETASESVNASENAEDKHEKDEDVITNGSTNDVHTVSTTLLELHKEGKMTILEETPSKPMNAIEDAVEDKNEQDEEANTLTNTERSEEAPSEHDSALDVAQETILKATHLNDNEIPIESNLNQFVPIEEGLNDTNKHVIHEISIESPSSSSALLQAPTNFNSEEISAAKTLLNLQQKCANTEPKCGGGMGTLKSVLKKPDHNSCNLTSTVKKKVRYLNEEEIKLKEEKDNARNDKTSIKHKAKCTLKKRNNRKNKNVIISPAMLLIPQNTDLASTSNNRKNKNVKNSPKVLKSQKTSLNSKAPIQLASINEVSLTNAEVMCPDEEFAPKEISTSRRRASSRNYNAMNVKKITDDGNKIKIKLVKHPLTPAKILNHTLEQNVADGNVKPMEEEQQDPPKINIATKTLVVKIKRIKMPEDTLTSIDDTNVDNRHSDVVIIKKEPLHSNNTEKVGEDEVCEVRNDDKCEKIDSITNAVSYKSQIPQQNREVILKPCDVILTVDTINAQAKAYQTLMQTHKIEKKLATKTTNKLPKKPKNKRNNTKRTSKTEPNVRSVAKVGFLEEKKDDANENNVKENSSRSDEIDSDDTANKITEGVIAELKLLSSQNMISEQESTETGITQNSDQCIVKHTEDERKTAQLLDSAIEQVLGNTVKPHPELDSAETTNDNRPKSSPTKGRLDVLTAEKINRSVTEILEQNRKALCNDDGNKHISQNDQSLQTSISTVSTQREQSECHNQAITTTDNDKSMSAELVRKAPAKKTNTKFSSNDVKTIPDNVPELIFAEDDCENCSGGEPEKVELNCSLNFEHTASGYENAKEIPENTVSGIENRKCPRTPNFAVELEIETTKSSVPKINGNIEPLTQLQAQSNETPEKLNRSVTESEVNSTLPSISDIDLDQMLTEVSFDYIPDEYIDKWPSVESDDVPAKDVDVVSNEIPILKESPSIGIDFMNNMTMADLLGNEVDDLFAISELEKSQSRRSSLSNDSAANVTSPQHTESIARDHSYIKNVPKNGAAKSALCTPEKTNTTQKKLSISPNKNPISPVSISTKLRSHPTQYWKPKKNEGVLAPPKRRISTIGVEQSFQESSDKRKSIDSTNGVVQIESIKKYTNLEDKSKTFYNMPELELSTPIVNDSVKPMNFMKSVPNEKVVEKAINCENQINANLVALKEPENNKSMNNNSEVQSANASIIDGAKKIDHGRSEVVVGEKQPSTLAEMSELIPTITPQPIIRIQSQTNRLELVVPVLNHCSSSSKEVCKPVVDHTLSVASSKDISNINDHPLQTIRGCTPTLDEKSKDIDLETMHDSHSSGDKSQTKESPLKKTFPKRESTTVTGDEPPLKKLLVQPEPTKSSISTNNILDSLEQDIPSSIISKFPPKAAQTPIVTKIQNVRCKAVITTSIPKPMPTYSKVTTCKNITTKAHITADDADAATVAKVPENSVNSIKAAITAELKEPKIGWSPTKKRVLTLDGTIEEISGSPQTTEDSVHRRYYDLSKPTKNTPPPLRRTTITGIAHYETGSPIMASTSATNINTPPKRSHPYMKGSNQTNGINASSAPNKYAFKRNSSTDQSHAPTNKTTFQLLTAHRTAQHEQSQSNYASTSTGGGSNLINLDQIKLSQDDEREIESKIEQYRKSLPQAQTYREHRENKCRIDEKRTELRVEYLEKIRAKMQMRNAAYSMMKQQQKQAHPKRKYVNKFSEIDQRKYMHAQSDRSASSSSIQRSKGRTNCHTVEASALTTASGGAPLTINTAWEPTQTNVYDIIEHLKMKRK